MTKKSNLKDLVMVLEESRTKILYFMQYIIVFLVSCLFIIIIRF